MRSFSPKLCILLLSTTLILPSICLAPFSTRGEAREALVAQAILQTDNWILPARYGEDFATKPPLTHWLIAALSIPIGKVTETTSRLPCALLSIWFVVTLYSFLSKKASLSVAVTASVMLLTSIEWFRSSIVARVDMVLSVLLAFALLRIYSWGEKRFLGLPKLLILVLSLAALSKGPVAIVLPCAVLLVYMKFSKIPLLNAILTSSRIGLISLLLPICWYLLAYRQGGQAFLDIVFAENLGRFTSTMEDAPHKHSVFYLLGALFVGLLPWSISILLYPRKVISNLSRIRSYFREIFLKESESTDLARFCWIVIAIFFLFYSIPSSKRGVYLLPIYPFACTLIAIQLTPYISKGRMDRFLKALSSFSILAPILLLTTSLVSLESLIHKEKTLIELKHFQNVLFHTILTLSPLPVMLLTGCSVLFAVSFFSSRIAPERRAMTSVLSFICSLLFFNVSIIPAIADSLSPKEFSIEIERLVPPSAALYSIDNQMFALNFYLRNRLRVFGPSMDLSSGDYLLLPQSDIPEIQARFSGKHIQILTASKNPVIKPTEIIALIRINENA